MIESSRDGRVRVRGSSVDVCVINSSQPTYMTVDTVITASQLANNNRQTKQSTQFQGLIITETFRPSNRRRRINLYNLWEAR